MSTKREGICEVSADEKVHNEDPVFVGKKAHEEMVGPEVAEEGRDCIMKIW